MELDPESEAEAEGTQAERLRCSKILQACQLAGRPSLAMYWIVSGECLEVVLWKCLKLATGVPARSPEAEFDSDVITFVEAGISRQRYVQDRQAEESRADR